MTINQQWVCNVSRYNRKLVYIDIIDIINKLNTTTLGCISRLDDPDILFAVMLF